VSWLAAHIAQPLAHKVAAARTSLVAAVEPVTRPIADAAQLIGIDSFHRFVAVMALVAVATVAALPPHDSVIPGHQQSSGPMPTASSTPPSGSASVASLPPSAGGGGTQEGAGRQPSTQRPNESGSVLTPTQSPPPSSQPTPSPSTGGKDEQSKIDATALSSL